jgi:hypothetical protein
VTTGVAQPDSCHARGTENGTLYSSVRQCHSLSVLAKLTAQRDRSGICSWVIAYPPASPLPALAGTASGSSWTM